jgi:hypothetical protein
LLRRFENGGVATGQRGCQLPGRHLQGEVPGDDLAHDAERLAQGIGEHVGDRNRNGIALQLGGPAREIAEVIGGQRHISTSGIFDGLAVVQRLQQCQFLGVLLDQLGDAPEQATALGRGESGPGAAFEGLARGGDGAIDIFGIALCDFRQHLPIGRVDGVEGFAAGRLNPLPADEHFDRLLPQKGDPGRICCICCHGCWSP